MRSRPLVIAAVTALALPLGVTAAHAATPPPDPITHVDLLAEQPGTGSDLAAQTGQVLERELATADAAVVGLAWTPRTDAEPTATIRFHTAAGWGDWQAVDMEAEGDGPVTSDAMVAVGADRVQVHIDGLAAAPLADAEIMLVDPPEAPTSAAAATPGGDLAASVPMPQIIPRSLWGASEVLPYAGCEPAYATRLERFVVHHTAGTNSYLPADSPRILRGIQQYHVSGRGWCDVGYNFLVDKYGQIFEGRRGGVDRLVIGVHASGQNSGGVGVSVLGNYAGIDPPQPAIDAVVRVIGWKSYLHGVDPTATSTKGGFAGPLVIGHRDVAQTACPGSFWNMLPAIRATARSIALSGTPALAGTSGGAGALFREGAAISTVVPVPAAVSFTISNGGGAVAQLARSTWQAGTIRQLWNGSVPGTDAYLPAGTYAVALAGTSTLGRPMSSTTSVTLGYPAGFVAADVPRVLDLGPTAGGDTTPLSVAGGLGLSAPDVAQQVLRVCSADADVTVTPDGRTHGARVDTSLVPGRCGLVVVPASPTGTLHVTRAAGSAATTVDGVGWLSATTPAMAFSDVPLSLTFASDIQWIFAAGITTGHPDGTYRPGSPVTREAMAAFIYRAAGAPTFAPPDRPTFVDVEAGHPFYAAIEWMAANHLVTGTRNPDGTVEFRPSEAISREAMAAFLFRLAGDAVPPAPAGQRPFADVPDGYIFEDAIRWMSQTGITTGYPDWTFRPGWPVTRDAMAAFLHRASGLV